MADDVQFTEGDDVFADIDADPLADTVEPELPPGVAEAELAGDNPSETPPPGEFLEEPEESDDLPEPGEIDPPAAEEPAPEPPAEPEPEPSAPEPEPEPVSPEPVSQGDDTPPAPDPALEPEPAPEPDPEPKTADPDPTEGGDMPPKPAAKQRKKAAKSKRKSGKKSDRQVSRPYVIFYGTDDETFKIGGIVEAREVEQAIRRAVPMLREKTGLSRFDGIAAVPQSNWNPVPVEAAQQVKDVVTIG
jgi:outer membrane biosynthesis protein TonB